MGILDKITEAMDLLRKLPPPPNPCVIGSRANIHEFVNALPRDVSVSNFDPVFGVPMLIDDRLPDEVPTGRAIFPEHRFVEYEQSDAAWAVSLGLATPEMESVVYVIDREAYCVQDVFEQRVLLGVEYPSLKNGYTLKDFGRSASLLFRG